MEPFLFLFEFSDEFRNDEMLVEGVSAEINGKHVFTAYDCVCPVF